MQSKPSIGVIFHPKFAPETLVEYARQAEQAGFDELWLWEDSFYAGALTSAATILAATRQIKVGIGLMPVTVRNPLFVAMEITTLACLYPGRFMPGFGHGVDVWMKQVGAYPRSPLRALEETVGAVRSLLHGEMTTIQGDHIHLDRVKLELVPQQVPPLFVGGIREKTLRLAGRVGDGTIMTANSSPAYLRWANQHIAAGMAEAGRAQNHRTVFAWCKVGPDGAEERAFARRALARLFATRDAHLLALGIQEEAYQLVQRYGVDEAANQMPDAWVDELAAAGRPEQAVDLVRRLSETGADSVILEPIEGDPDALQGYIRYLMPLLKE